MKKITLLTLSLVLAPAFLMAGGIVTNTNQSASWARNPSTASYIGIESAYYNPAGISLLNNGFHLSLSNQYINQSRQIENFYNGLNNSKYEGSVKAPLFPTVYAVYKMDKLALSLNFNPIGGGGGAEFEKGLPSFEFAAADLVPKLSSQGAQAYQLDAYFKGTSIYYGYQFGIAYKINDMVSVSAGARYVQAKNVYEGYLRNIQLQMGANWIDASAVLGGVAANFNSMLGVPASLQPLIDGGGGGLTLVQANGAGYITSDQLAGIQQGLAVIGMSAEQIAAMTIEQVQGAYTTATPVLTQQYHTAAIGSRLVRNQEADVTQKGSGFCPVVGINFNLADKLNIAIKYEFATKMELTNETVKDFVTDSLPGQPATTMFPDGAKTPADMPALLSVGASYKVIDNLSVSGSFCYYLDKAVKYGKKIGNEFVTNDKLMDANYIDIAAGVEYGLSEKLLISTGVLYGKTGIKPEYNSDLSYSNSATTIGIGGKYSINPNIAVNLGFAYTAYAKTEKTANFSKSYPEISSKESYLKTTMVIGAGIDISFGK
ncbi:MAG: outer membrane protein transport protein [Bacteroidales bacterium]|nr:outer membrane protein transport protein [Bacteroidales bacterium]